ncbi:MAG: delta-60 repeat domain-containing protein, partial [Anaerolineales bacterium]|nr:delta-60 repeat domain-containing protein [Anaerolineales bacterium]
MRSVRTIDVAPGAMRALLLIALLALLLLTGESTVFAADGDLDTTFGDPKVGDPLANEIVYALAIQTDGKVVIGGSFTMVGSSSTPMNRVARLNADGSRDTTFGNPDANGTVYALALQADGKILIGGDFTSVGGTTRNYVARLNANGTLDDSFDPNPNVPVRALALQSDRK